MVASADWRPPPGTIPDAPGVYRFRDEQGRVVYVGKAKSLRARLSSYFQDARALHPRTQAMVGAARAVEWTLVANEVEALQLEYAYIKEFDPRYNIRYRDDKSYPHLAVTLDEDFPRAQVMRGPKRKRVKYFGPYAHAWAIRETLDLLLRVFPVRTCSAGVFRRAQQTNRPCLLAHIDKCSAPCVGWVTPEQHHAHAADLCDFLSGSTNAYLRRLEREMSAASGAMEFERAARLRDDVAALRRAIERNTIVLAEGTDADVIGLADDPLAAAVQVFFVRDGRVRGQRGWVVDKAEDLDAPALVALFLEQAYGDAEPDAIPREVLVPTLPDDPGTHAEWLSLRRGGKVALRSPERGDKRGLLETVTRNAEQSLALHKLHRAGDLPARSRALAEIQGALGLAEAPLRIECIDVSHLHGNEVVGSLVVFEDGLARKSDYRRFAIRGDGNDDTAAIAEIVRRRFARLHDEPAAAEDGRPRKFAYPPQLLVVDGGAPQVAAAARAMDEVGAVDIALCGVAKRLEEVWLPDRPEPIILARPSEGLHLLQRVRDEAHRFAVAFHRAKRTKSMTASALDDIAGIGASRRAALLRHFGSVAKLRAASVEEIAQVPGMGPKGAAVVSAALAQSAASATADPTTGEVIP